MNVNTQPTSMNSNHSSTNVDIQPPLTNIGTRPQHANVNTQLHQCTSPSSLLLQMATPTIQLMPTPFLLHHVSFKKTMKNIRLIANNRKLLIWWKQPRVCLIWMKVGFPLILDLIYLRLILYLQFHEFDCLPCPPPPPTNDQFHHPGCKLPVINI